MGFLYLIFGVVSYILFFVTFLYAIAFVGNLPEIFPQLSSFVPRTIDHGIEGASLVEAIFINSILLAIFALQHSVMARQSFKKAWTKIIPSAIERSVYVLLSSFALILMYWQWRSISNPIWDLRGNVAGGTLQFACYLGWSIVLVSTFLLDHFELFGLKQVYYNFKGKDRSAPQFRSPLFYKFVRHPIYFGFTLAFWATPYMSGGHLLFAVMTLGYTLVGIFLEEKDLVSVFGDKYIKYKSSVSMIIPMPRKKNK